LGILPDFEADFARILQRYAPAQAVPKITQEEIDNGNGLNRPF
jgi:hypothetical protein